MGGSENEIHVKFGLKIKRYRAEAPKMFVALYASDPSSQNVCVEQGGCACGLLVNAMVTLYCVHSSDTLTHILY